MVGNFWSLIKVVEDDKDDDEEMEEEVILAFATAVTFLTSCIAADEVNRRRWLLISEVFSFSASWILRTNDV